MAVAIKNGTGERERGVIPLNAYSFHREYAYHGVFEVSITDEHGPFVYQVRSWGNMIRTVEAFTECIAHSGAARIAKVDIYRTGYAGLNGYNIRVTPLTAITT
ncbi:hypothetical protein [Streptomyces antibioticus]|uniref:hypothetical protein n=1 Tax=Streptomyces antibioticus TaxID=1890 RepID=UPI0033D6DC2F